VVVYSRCNMRLVGHKVKNAEYAQAQIKVSAAGSSCFMLSGVEGGVLARFRYSHTAGNA
jgi:hypothetical protein